MKACLICENEVNEFISFGKMPIANGFLKEDEYADEYFFELKVGFCPSCSMVQLTEQVERERMFHDQYAFFSSTSKGMQKHFKEFANDVIENYIDIDGDPFVVEIGSNDGIMLDHFKEQKIRHLGIEPSSNVAQVAKDRGIHTITDFFDEQVAEKIVAEHGQADAFLGANVMCHIPYLHSVIEGIRILLKPKGLLMFEDPYIGDIIVKTSYDQIYDEHAFYFSLESIDHLMKMHRLELIDAKHQETHGGSMRYIIGHQGAHTVSDNLKILKDVEASLNLGQLETYNTFSENVNASKKSLMNILNDLSSQGKKVVGYAATSKSTTVTNYCGITTDHLAYISDTTPIKQGKFSPGAHIPVMPYEKFKANYPDYALLFAWNHAKEIKANEKEYIESGGKWIYFVPKVTIEQ